MLYLYIPLGRYLTQGAPVVLSTSLPALFLLLCLDWAPNVWGLMSLGGWVVGAYSLLAHKEFRFIMPVVPIASILAGKRNTQIIMFRVYWKHNYATVSTYVWQGVQCLLWSYRLKLLTNQNFTRH